jgi:hypothetical protein
VVNGVFKVAILNKNLKNKSPYLLKKLTIGEIIFNIPTLLNLSSEPTKMKCSDVRIELFLDESVNI